MLPCNGPNTARSHTGMQAGVRVAWLQPWCLAARGLSSGRADVGCPRKQRWPYMSRRLLAEEAGSAKATAEQAAAAAAAQLEALRAELEAAADERMRKALGALEESIDSLTSRERGSAASIKVRYMPRLLQSSAGRGGGCLVGNWRVDLQCGAWTQSGQSGPAGLFRYRYVAARILHRPQAPICPLCCLVPGRVDCAFLVPWASTYVQALEARLVQGEQAVRDERSRATTLEARVVELQSELLQAANGKAAADKAAADAAVAAAGKQAATEEATAAGAAAAGEEAVADKAAKKAGAKQATTATDAKAAAQRAGAAAKAEVKQASSAAAKKAAADKAAEVEAAAVEKAAAKQAAADKAAAAEKAAAVEKAAAEAEAAAEKAAAMEKAATKKQAAAEEATAAEKAATKRKDG